MKKLFIYTLLLLISTVSFAQDSEGVISLKGNVIDSSTSGGIPFASVWIEGTYIGIATDADGSFVVNIPSEYNESTLVFSAVGYSRFESAVKDCASLDPLVVTLQPKLFIINEVNVLGKSLVLQRILRNAVDNISTNYIQSAFSYDSYYKSEFFEGDSLVKSREAVVNIYDENAYHRSSLANTFKSVNYKFTEARRTYENKTLADGSTLLDDLLTFDIVRNTRNILDKHNLALYELTSDGDVFFEGDSLSVIAYKALSNQLSVIGQVGIKSYSGKIYINKSNYAVVKNELNIEISQVPTIGKSIINASGIDNNVMMKIVSSYGKIANHYYLRGVSCDVMLNNNESRKYQLLPLKIKISNPDVFYGRDYYEDEDYKKDYWERFSIIFEGEE